jgi:hypothetical protein
MRRLVSDSLRAASRQSVGEHSLLHRPSVWSGASPRQSDLSGVPRFLEVVRRSRSKGPSKCSNEGTWRAVTRFRRGVSYLGATSEQAHGLHKPKSLPPFTERHAGLSLEQSLQGSHTRAHRLAILGNGLAISRFSKQQFSEPRCP